VQDATLSLKAGEVLGVTGLLGSGFEELPYLIAGAREAKRGTLVLGGREFDLPRASVRDLLAAGVALVPERRGVEGLALTETVLENVTLPRVRGVHLGRGWQERETEWVLRELGVRPADPRMVAGRLSGGNQQKVLLGKWLCGRPRLLLLHEPTQGVDVGARRDLERAVGRVAEQGAAVLLAGMDAGELASLCDRVVVLKEGRVHAELTEDLSGDVIIEAVYGNGRATVAA
jgi:ribose transport system ATP-binding protein